MTLANLLTDLGTSSQLYDAPSGQPIEDRADDYTVLSTIRIDGYTFAAVRGPSGDVDALDTTDGARLHRAAMLTGDAGELNLWWIAGNL